LNIEQGTMNDEVVENGRQKVEDRRQRAKYKRPTLNVEYPMKEQKAEDGRHNTNVQH